jgi:carboxypeptidase C (cathepsin A)
MPNSDPFSNLFKHSDKLKALKTALHISEESTFSKLNSIVADELGFDGTSNSTYMYTELLSRGLQVLINVGQFDMKDGVRQQFEWTKNIDFADRKEFDSQARSEYLYYKDGQEHSGGYYRSAGNFTLIVTPKAGHMVAFSQT